MKLCVSIVARGTGLDLLSIPVSFSVVGLILSMAVGLLPYRVLAGDSTTIQCRAQLSDEESTSFEILRRSDVLVSEVTRRSWQLLREFAGSAPLPEEWSQQAQQMGDPTLESQSVDDGQRRFVIVLNPHVSRGQMDTLLAAVQSSGLKVSSLKDPQREIDGLFSLFHGDYGVRLDDRLGRFEIVVSGSTKNLVGFMESHRLPEGVLEYVFKEDTLDRLLCELPWAASVGRPELRTLFVNAAAERWAATWSSLFTNYPTKHPFSKGPGVKPTVLMVSLPVGPLDPVVQEVWLKRPAGLVLESRPPAPFDVLVRQPQWVPRDSVEFFWDVRMWQPYESRLRLQQDASGLGRMPDGFAQRWNPSGRRIEFLLVSFERNLSTLVLRNAGVLLSRHLVEVEDLSSSLANPLPVSPEEWGRLRRSGGLRHLAEEWARVLPYRDRL